MLVNLSQLVQPAASGGYAVAAFNVFGYEDAKAVVRAAESLDSPVILAVNKVAIAHMPLEIIAPILLELCRKAAVPVCVHLDHGADYETAARAIRCGFTSVMYDGSQLPLEENIRKTREIVRMAHAFGVCTEAEIGSVGYSDKTLGMKHEMSDPLETEQFIRETGVDAVAVSIGTVHRMETQSAQINFGLLEEIERCVSIPLVLHGATGVPDDQLKQIIRHRIGKINIGTSLRMAFGLGLRREIESDPHSFDRIAWMQKAMTDVEEAARKKIRIFESGGKHK